MTTEPAPRAVPFGEALRFWLRLGFLSFGGPAGQIALMHRELVQERRWISESRFLHALNYCMLLPGPEAQQLATYIGWLMHRTWGGIAAGALFVLPSLGLLIALSWVYLVFGQLPWVAALFHGIKPAVAALVLQAVLFQYGGFTVLGVNTFNMAFPAVLGFLLLPFPWVVLGAALTGWVGSRLALAPFGAHAAAGTGGRGAVPAPALPALIDDHTPTPPHARFTPARLARVLAAGALLWLAPMALLLAWQGREGPLAQMGWFFTKAALLTFGGAYAVLPYVYQGAVAHFHWLTGPQMIDGLALGETTPGPLIMVVAFVGFLGGWDRQVLGPDHLALGAALAALVIIWFTFLPSFIFILAGGPLVESTHGKLHFTAPLAAITAAVVGVIASLALFFIAHIALPTLDNGLFSSKIDWVALGLMVACAWALIRRRAPVLGVIGASALAGLGLHLLAGRT